jgi:hypothetical protein
MINILDAISIDEPPWDSFLFQATTASSMGMSTQLRIGGGSGDLSTDFSQVRRRPHLPTSPFPTFTATSPPPDPVVKSATH